MMIDVSDFERKEPQISLEMDELKWFDTVRRQQEMKKGS